MRSVRTGKGWKEALPDDRLLPLNQIDDDKYYIIKETSYDWTNKIMNVTLEEVEIIGT
ncbi:MAG: hypothetical protein Q8933_09405 [Bacteroidota bacterium]|nr:hypothetical protein [Bacteroidota bacterium]